MFQTVSTIIEMNHGIKRYVKEFNSCNFPSSEFDVFHARITSRQERTQKQGSKPMKGVFCVQRGFLGWCWWLLWWLWRLSESRRKSVGCEGVTFSINSIQASKSMPKSMKAQSMPSRLYSSCSKTNMWWLKNCCNFSFVKLMQICSKPLNYRPFRLEEKREKRKRWTIRKYRKQVEKGVCVN